MSKLKRLFNSRLQKKQDVQSTISGVLGNGLGAVNVPARTNYVYVRMSGYGLTEVYNNRVAAVNDLPVICGYDPLNPGKFQILTINGNLSESSGIAAGIVGYAPSGRYRWMYPGGGQDPLFIEGRQYMPLRVSISGMGFKIYNQVIWNGTEWMEVGGETVYDLITHVPSTVGKAAMVLITIADNGDVVLTKGTEVDIPDMVVSDIPAPPEGTRHVLGALRVYYEQIIPQEARTNTDFVDLRFPGIGGGGGAGELSELGDVTLTNPSDGDLLAFDNILSKWVNVALPPGSGHTIQDAGTDMTNRGKLNFIGFTITDDSGNGATVIELPQAADSQPGLNIYLVNSFI